MLGKSRDLPSWGLYCIGLVELRERQDHVLRAVLEGLGIRGEVRVWGFGFGRARGYDRFVRLGDYTALAYKVQGPMDPVYRFVELTAWGSDVEDVEPRIEERFRV